MSQTLIISDKLHEELKAVVQKRGLDSIEELLEIWQANEAELRQREEIVRQIDVVREQLYSKYGEMPDSVEFIHEDRAR